MGHATPSELLNVSPSEEHPSSQRLTPENKNKRDAEPSGQEDNSFVNSRVARLSICEDSTTASEIMAGLKDSEKVEMVQDSNNGNSDQQNGKRGKRSKRRRSSAVSGPGSAKVRQSVKQAASTQAPVTKKKKKVLKALLEVREIPAGRKINIKDLRDLVVFILGGTNNCPKWINIENRQAIRKVVVFLVPGLQVEDFGFSSDWRFSNSQQALGESCLKDLSDSGAKKDLQVFPVSAPGSNTSLFSAYNSFINVGLSKKEKKIRREELDSKKITISDLILSLDDLIENNYPIHRDTPGITDTMRQQLIQHYEQDPIEYVSTAKFDHEGSHIFALDCEMCLAKDGLVLTRVSMVDFNLTVIYDKLVKPDVPIIDYLTKYSGITEEKLLNVDTKLQDVQQDILKIVSADDILIGHSLQSDLDALQMKHPKIVDTAVIFDHKAGPPFRPALRYLASTYLEDDIQNNDAVGHDSIEDSIACMKLVKMKIANGMGFGITANTEDLFRLLGKVGVKSIRLSDSGPKLSVSTAVGCESAIRCRSDAEIISGLHENLNKNDLLVCRLRGLEFARGYATPPIIRSCEVPNAEDALAFFSDSLQKTYNDAPSGTLIMVMSGSGNTKKWSEIMTAINKLDKAERTEERQRREKDIEEALAVARDGVGMMLLKQSE
ncbi:hypothetical protein HG536_0A00460 [Torulaspora globosa]|uniref:Exonuclease domain-containing protein n=1 Tax=Torulaspora globosa TaxID=48254 RepID=A0A7G3Z9P3_9SACH|nr:uncharacterized protein HG536_0A00460 [Torulaspora globosa]QLL30229.1 hypothetical protein HG536_0A00460 [Torulaspora globosa]